MKDPKKRKKIIIIASSIFIVLIAALGWFVFGGSKKLANINHKAQIDENNGIIYMAQNEQFNLKEWFMFNDKYAKYANYKVKDPYGKLNITEDLIISSSQLGKSRIDIYDDNNNLIDDFTIKIISNSYLKTLTGFKIDDFDPENTIEYDATKDGDTANAETADENAKVGICTEDEIKNEKCNLTTGKISRTLDDNISKWIIRVENDASSEPSRTDYKINIINDTANNLNNDNESIEEISSQENTKSETNNTVVQQDKKEETNNTTEIQTTKELECPVISVKNVNFNKDNWTNEDIEFEINFKNSNATSYAWFTAQNVDSKNINKFNWYLWDGQNSDKLNNGITSADVKENHKKLISNTTRTHSIKGSGYRKINVRIYNNNKYKDCGSENTYKIDKTVPKIVSVDASTDGYKPYDITVNATSSISPIKDYEFTFNNDNQPKIVTKNKYTVNPTKDMEVTVRVRNQAGGYSAPKTIKLKKLKTFVVDAVSKAKDGKQTTIKDGEWTNGDVTLTVKTENNKNNIIKYSIYNPTTKKWDAWKDKNTVTLTKEGQYTVKFGLYDSKAKKWLTYKDCKLNIDKTAPTVSVNNPYKTTMLNESGTIKVTGKDSLSGIKQYVYRKEKGSWTKFGGSNQTENLNLSTLGVTSKTNVSFSVMDRAGNVSNAVNEVVYPINNSIAVDCKLRNTTGKKEVTNVNYVYGVGFNSNPAYTNKFVSCTAKSNIEGAKISYKLASDSASMYCNENGKAVDCRNKEIFSATRHIMADGTSKITFIAKAGNVTKTIDVKVNIDMKAPAVPTLNMLKWINNTGARPTRTTNHNNLSSVKYSANTWSNKKILVTPTSVDKNGSGIDHYEYTTTGRTTHHTNQKGDYRNIETNGTSTIKYRACDKAGNCSNYSKPVTVKIDYNSPKVPAVNMYKWKSNDLKTSPTRKAYKGLLEGKYTDNSWSNKKIFTTASSSDSESGIDHYEITVRGAAANQTAKKATHWNLSAKGTSKISWRACDKAGNCSASSNINTVNIDYTKPICKPTQSKSGTTITVSPNCTDAESRVEKVQVYVTKGSATWSDSQEKWYNLNGSFTVKAYGNSTLRFKSQDKAGNWSEISSITVSNPKPVVSNNYNYDYNYESTITDSSKSSNKPSCKAGETYNSSSDKCVKVVTKDPSACTKRSYVVPKTVKTCHTELATADHCRIPVTSKLWCAIAGCHNVCPKIQVNKCTKHYEYETKYYNYCG